MTSNVKKYKHLTKEERDIIEFMLKDEYSLTREFNTFEIIKLCKPL